MGKIIATTDISLQYHDKTLIGENVNGLWKCLSQISQSFVEYFISEYNKSNIITKVGVEYEYQHDSSVSYPKTLDGKEVLKTNHDNTINIKPIKTSWTKEEVIAYGKLAFDVGRNFQLTGENNLSEIEDNL